MTTLHLITGEPDYSLLCTLMNQDDEVVLLSEGVYELAPLRYHLNKQKWQKQIRVLRIDFTLRGLIEDGSTALIDYSDLVTLTLQSTRSITW